jgi:hypothetical protein
MEREWKNKMLKRYPSTRNWTKDQWLFVWKMTYYLDNLKENDTNKLDDFMET